MSEAFKCQRYHTEMMEGKRDLQIQQPTIMNIPPDAKPKYIGRKDMHARRTAKPPNR